MNNKGPLASAWLSDPKSRFFGYDHAGSVKIVDQLTQMGATEIHTAFPPAPDFSADGVIARLPKDPEAREKIFAWYDGLDHVIEADDEPRPQEAGQTFISVEFRPE
jgi:hypothetical protein